MKICAAQTNPIKGDIDAKIANHKKLIERAGNDWAELYPLQSW